MAPKRKTAEELFHLHKRLKTSEASTSHPPPPTPLSNDPAGTEPESSTAHIRREAVEEYKKSPEFEELVAMVGSQFFVEGFYACRNWIQYLMPQLELNGVGFSVIPPRCRYLSHNYLQQAERALMEKIAAEAEKREEEEAKEVEIATPEE